MMRGVLSFLLFLFWLSAFAQQGDSISNHEDSIQQIVSQNRRLLLDKFYATRLDSVSLFLDSIDRCHRDQPFLLPAERLLLYYWIERYDAIDSLVRHFDDFSEEVVANAPQEQTVWNVLSYYSQEKLDLLVTWIDQTDCSNEVFNFRVHVLKTLLHNELEDQTVDREIHSLMKFYFLQESQTPPEAPNVASKQVEPHQSDDDPWRVGVGIGLGTVSTSGKIANYLSAKTCLSFDLNANYNQWYFSLLLQAVFAKLKRDMPVKNGGDIWETGKSAFINNFGLSAGYSVINSRVLRISPFIGMAVSDCSPSDQQIEDNSALNDAGIRWGFTNFYGMDMDVKLYKMIDYLNRKEFFSTLNIRLNYIPAMFNNVDSRYSGNMFFVTFGVRMDVSTR
jgi:hypothetical protein